MKTVDDVIQFLEDRARKEPDKLLSGYLDGLILRIKDEVAGTVTDDPIEVLRKLQWI